MQAGAGNVVAFGVDTSALNISAGPVCWIVLSQLNEGMADARRTEQFSDAHRVLHFRETLFRESAVLLGINTIGPLPSGAYELRLTECYGSVTDQMDIALVRREF